MFQSAAPRWQGPDRQNRLIWKNRGPFRDSIDIAGKTKLLQEAEKLLAKQIFLPQIINILLCKVQPLYIINHLLQSSSNGKTAAVGNAAEEHIKIGNSLPQPIYKIAVRLCKLIKSITIVRFLSSIVYTILIDNFHLQAFHHRGSCCV